MRRVLTLAALLLVLGLTGFLGGAAMAQSGSCTVTCPSGQVMTCYPTSYCTSVPGTSINCDGTTTYCPPSCEEQCEINYFNCSFGCDPSIPTTCRICDRAYNACLNNCP